MKHAGADRTFSEEHAGLRDVHCHILPGVDDGSPDLATSKAMLDAAVQAGIGDIVCTPHCRWDAFSKQACMAAYGALLPYAHDCGVHTVLAFEVYYDKLMDIGIDKAPLLCNPATSEFLLELPTGQKPVDLERTLFQLQGMGLHVIIAHPERYAYVQNDIDQALEWHQRGCRLQLSSNFVSGGITSKSKKTAHRLLAEGVVSFIASDAHEPAHYRDFAQAMGKYASKLSP